jgi:hypothetical protein
MGPTPQRENPQHAAEGEVVGRADLPASERRQRLIRAITACALVLALSVGLFVLADTDDEAPAPAGGEFGTHYEGLEERRLAAGVPTMSDPGTGEHIHPQLEVYAHGEQIPIPVNVGIDPSRPPEMMAGLHTHDTSGVIHVENADQPTLGQFFQIWGVPFSADGLGPYEAGGDERVRVWVDGQESSEYGDLVIEDGQQIVVAFGSTAQTPEAVRG